MGCAALRSDVTWPDFRHLPPSSRVRRIRTLFHKATVLIWIVRELTRNPYTGAIDSSTVLAYGAAMFAHNSKGGASARIRSFRKALSEVSVMVLINEFRTSKLCSRCHTTYMKGVRQPGVKSELRGVRDCSLCHTKWMRDVNSARNMYYLFWYAMAADGARPMGYAPGTKAPRTVGKASRRKATKSGKGKNGGFPEATHHCTVLHLAFRHGGRGIERRQRCDLGRGCGRFWAGGAPPDVSEAWLRGRRSVISEAHLQGPWQCRPCRTASFGGDQLVGRPRPHASPALYAELFLCQLLGSFYSGEPRAIMAEISASNSRSPLRSPSSYIWTPAHTRHQAEIASIWTVPSRTFIHFDLAARGLGEAFFFWMLE